MRLKTGFFAIVLLLSFSALAQDKLYKKDGTVIAVIVKTVGSNTINYTRFDNQGGPEYTILKKEVSKIIYQNGTTDNFNEKTSSNDKGLGDSKNGKFAKKYGNNIISIIPGAYTASVDGTINDVGIGISYERFLDPKCHISLCVPVLFSFSSNKDYNNSIVYNGQTSYNSYTSVYFMPGIKFYPASRKEKVRYSIGASFFTIFGSEPYSVYDNYNNGGGLYPEPGSYNYVMYGFIISNSVNISVTKHMYFAIDLGTGIPISDNRYAQNNSIGLGQDGNGIFDPWIQCGLKVGYRF